MNLKNEYELNKDLVTLKETSNPDLFVLKYKRKVFYDGKWNAFLRECRGLIVDKDFNIVTYPFTKIHNYGVEDDAPAFDDDEVVFASRKVNGFMIAVTWYKDQLLWSTTGSIDSDFVAYAQDIYFSWTQEQRDNFRLYVKGLEGHTLMFECVHEKDPHIIEETPGLYFLGMRYNEIGSYVKLGTGDYEKREWHETGVIAVEAGTMLFSELKELARTCKHEGFVFESADGKRVSKIKSPHYLAKKALMRGNWQKFLNKNGKFELDEEFYKLHQWIHEVERERFFELDELARREYIERFFST